MNLKLQTLTLFSIFSRRYRKKLEEKFIETNELLGRGKIITAYENNDVGYIKNSKKKISINRETNEKPSSRLLF